MLVYEAQLLLLYLWLQSSSLKLMAVLFTYFMSGKTKADGQVLSVWDDQVLHLV